MVYLIGKGYFFCRYVYRFGIVYQTGINSNSNTSNGVYQMSLLINVYSKSKTKNFSAVKAVDSDSLYCCIADYDKNTVDYFFFPVSALDDLKALTSFTALAKYAKAHRSDKPFSPTVTTDNKEVSMMGHEPVGVVESAGEALSVDDYFSDDIDSTDLYEHPASEFQPEVPKRFVRLEKSIARRCERFIEALKPFANKTIPPLFKTYSKTKTDDPANYRHEVRYAPIDDDFDDVPF